MPNESDPEVDFDDIEAFDNEKEATIVAAAIIVGGIVTAVGNPAEPILSFGFGAVFFGVIAWMLGTSPGREYVKKMNSDFQDSQTQVGGSTSSEEKRICSNCGWQNNKRFTYCNDCGNKIKTEPDGSN